MSTRKRNRQQHRKRAAGVSNSLVSDVVDTPATISCQSKSSNDSPPFDQWNCELKDGKVGATKRASQFLPGSEEDDIQWFDSTGELYLPTQSENTFPAVDEGENLEKSNEMSNHQVRFRDPIQGTLGEGTYDFLGGEGNSLMNENMTRSASVAEELSKRFGNQRARCALSDQTAREYARSTMTRNLIRIYHDSMENALSCWLTERNCPYSRLTRDGKPRTAQSEWGPSFSNRMCTRVCRLDAASTSVRGRSLSAAEDQAASRALHKSIMAFASQWSQHFEHDNNLFSSRSLAQDERSLRESLWNDARHSLEASLGVPSFRVVFANILFSLTQRPLNDEEGIGLGELLEKDYAPTYLENAVRQMFSFRYKFAQIRPGTRSQAKSQQIISNALPTSSCSDSPISERENRDTFDLLFWLGVMFDTQIAAMHQRPPVVSDEDSQRSSDSAWALTPLTMSDNSFDLDGFSLYPHRTSKRKRDLWDNFLLQKPASYQIPDKGMPTWPCSHEEAAEILSDAAPVKVLLWRRITQLQTLIYRDEEPELIEEGIQKALLVYRHWNNTYNHFIINCVSNHAVLPPRVQSWYVILAAHWHLGAMLLADVIENIDQANLSLEQQRSSRTTIEFASTLRRDNALAVATLAKCSLEDDLVKSSQFHDCLNDAAFLTEPFTVLLVHSFAKSADILLNSMEMAISSVYCGPIGMFERFREGCEVCIRALKFLGRKSDLASLVARGLLGRLNSKIHLGVNDEENADLASLTGIESHFWTTGAAYNFEELSTVDHASNIWL